MSYLNLVQEVIDIEITARHVAALQLLYDLWDRGQDTVVTPPASQQATFDALCGWGLIDLETGARLTEKGRILARKIKAAGGVTAGRRGRLSAGDMAELRKRHDAGEPVEALADEFGVSPKVAERYLSGALQSGYPAKRSSAADARVRREALLDSIITYKHANDGIAPSIRDLVHMTDYTSTSVVAYNLRCLEADGLIEIGAGARNIRVVGARWLPPQKQVA